MTHNAIRLETNVGPNGKLEVTVPLAPGTPVEVLVLASNRDEFGDLVDATRSSTDFWDNPWDDEDWNHA
ncbi:MAG: hypothetical protein L0Y72_32205 [Gemmataceae bacterium]|nr:hypothetical protein [Gemmataceae bacterium]MCI0743719.1 hypothetical protein [Gemmataceae bacterium]